MTKFAIYQIQLTDAEIIRVNNGEVLDKREHSLDMSMPMVADDEMKNLALKGILDGHYTRVATIEAEDYNDVWRAGNDNNRDRFELIDRMHSVSTGDMILNVDTGALAVVKSFGFLNI